MDTSKGRFANTGLLVLFTVASLLLVTASPALAAEAVTGAGGGTGWEWAGTGPDICTPPDDLGVPPFGETSGAEFELDHMGTFAAVDSATGETEALYVGPTRVTINVGTHVISPAGVGPTCTVPLGPVEVDSAMVTTPTGASGGGFVTCNFPVGFYERVSSAVSFQLLGECTVRGNQEVITDPDGDPVLELFTGETRRNVATDMVISGTMNPCDVPVIDPTNEFEPLVFVPNPECDVEEQPERADPSSHLVTTYQAAGAQQDPILPD